jgi:uncharacterized RmlC-like cupin family protein
MIDRVAGKEEKLVSTNEAGRLAQGGVRIIKPHQFDANTPQTPGMQRMAAVSRELAGSQGIWGGITVVAPNIASGIHHHGEIETIIYVVSGHGKMRWGDKMEFEQEVEPVCTSPGDQSFARYTFAMGNRAQLTRANRC